MQSSYKTSVIAWCRGWSFGKRTMLFIMLVKSSIYFHLYIQVILFVGYHLEGCRIER